VIAYGTGANNAFIDLWGGAIRRCKTNHPRRASARAPFFCAGEKRGQQRANINRDELKPRALQADELYGKKGFWQRAGRRDLQAKFMNSF
jgi:hypothetical protein